MDYTPQAVYWLGGELSQNREFEWTDGSAMNFQVSFCKMVAQFSAGIFFNLRFVTGLATWPRYCRQATKRKLLFGIAMEKVANTNATIRHILDISEMFQVWRLHLQKEETKRRRNVCAK